MNSQSTLSPIRHMAQGIYIAAQVFSLKRPLFEGIAKKRMQRLELGRKLIEAVKNNKPEEVPALLAQKASVKVKDEFGQTALWWAAKIGSCEMMRLLLKVGAGADSANYAGFTPLIQAAIGGHTDATVLLLENGADPDKRDTTHGWNSSMWALACGYPKLQTLLETYEYNPDEVRGPGNRPLRRG